VSQRRGNISSGTGAENQHVLERVAEDRARPLIEYSFCSTGAID
jgi:hypothetical protein